MSLVALTPDNTKVSSLACELIQEIETEGYYFKTNKGYFKAASFNIQWEFGFNKLGSIPYAEIDNEDIRMVIYKKNWSHSDTYFLMQPLDIVNHDVTYDITPQIKPLMHDRYELTFPGLKPEHLLIIRDINGFYCSSFNSISNHLERLFQITQAAPHAVLGNLQSSLKSFPDNVILKNSLPIWQLRRDHERAADIWIKIQEKWQEYTTEDRPGHKEVFAANVEDDIRYYRSLADDLPELKNCEIMLDTIQKDKEDAALLKSNKVIVIPNVNDIRGAVSRFRAHNNNISITIVSIGDEGDVLIRFKGIPNHHDGKVYRHTKKIQNDMSGAFIYATDEIDGDNWNTLSLENDGWGDERLFVYPPEIDQQVDIYEDNNQKDEAIEEPTSLIMDYIARIQ